jgi:hypothetical protein
MNAKVEREDDEDFDPDGENLAELEKGDHCACEGCCTVGSLADEGTVCRDCGGRGIMRRVIKREY